MLRLFSSCPGARCVGAALALCASLTLGDAAMAQSPLAPGEGADGANGRYAMTPTANGFLRLDTRTGAVSLCVVEGAAVKCHSSADERGALEAEIERLSRANADLRRRLADAAGATGMRPPVAGPPAGLPSDEEFDRALSLAERFMRRMMRTMKDEAPKDDKL